MKIGIAALSHETNTFAVERNDTMECVRLRRGAELLTAAHPKSFIGGFAEGARRDDIELVPGVGIGFAHGGIIGRQTFEECHRQIIESLAAMGPLDGVFFAFHGAMVAEAPYTDFLF